MFHSEHQATGMSPMCMSYIMVQCHTAKVLLNPHLVVIFNFSNNLKNLYFKYVTFKNWGGYLKF